MTELCPLTMDAQKFYDLVNKVAKDYPKFYVFCSRDIREKTYKVTGSGIFKENNEETIAQLTFSENEIVKYDTDEKIRKMLLTLMDGFEN